MRATNVLPYQVDYSVASIGQVVASSKKRIRFRFGFANNAALDAGAKGVACRGCEHEVTLIWSLASGKCVVMFDGKKIQHSVGGGGKFQFSWQMKGEHILEIVAHASPCSSKSDAPVDWRQNDLFINGMSYFNLRKIFELGIRPSQHLEVHSAGVYQGNNASFATPTPPGHGYEEQMPRGREPPAEANLLDFSDSQPAIAQAPAPPQPDNQQYGAPAQPQENDMVAFAVPPAQAATNSFASPPTQAPVPSNDCAFSATVPQQPNPHDQNPTANDVPDSVAPLELTHSSSSFMSPLTACSPHQTFDLEEEPVAPTKPSEVVVQPQQPEPSPEQNDERRNPATMSGVERAVDNLVNLSDITAPVNLQIGKLTLMPSPEEQSKNITAPKDINRPLSEIQAEAKKDPKKTIMNSFNPSSAAQGMGMSPPQQPMQGQGAAYPGQQMPPMQQPAYEQGPPPLNNGYGGFGMGGGQPQPNGYGNFQQQQQPQPQSYANYTY